MLFLAYDGKTGTVEKKQKAGREGLEEGGEFSRDHIYIAIDFFMGLMPILWMYR
jgi:hypothetical protein